MENYNHQAGLKIVGEVLSDERNQVTLADETDEFGLQVARVTFSYGENDRKLIGHAVRWMRDSLAAAGVHELWDENDDTCHLNGTAPLEWATTGVRASSMPIAAAGISQTCGYAMGRSFQPVAASTLR
jgi:hypothetical protein